MKMHLLQEMDIWILFSIVLLVAFYMEKYIYIKNAMLTTDLQWVIVHVASDSGRVFLDQIFVMRLTVTFSWNKIKQL